MISIFLNLLRFDLSPKMWSILENVPGALEKKVNSSAFGWDVLTISMRSISSKVSFKTCVCVLKEKTVRNTNTWRVNMILNNNQLTEEIKREMKKFLEANDNENMTTQNLWDAAKAVLRGKLIAIQIAI